MREALRQRRRAALLVGVALIAAGLSTLACDQHLLRRIEQQTVDARYQVRGTDRSKTAAFVLVAIDPTTFNDFRTRHLHAHWPFPRRYDAQVIDRLHHAGARSIAFDVQYTEETNPTDDNALIEAAGRARDLVFSTNEVGEHGTTNVLGGAEVLRAVGARAGESQVINDSDGVVRRTQYETGGLESFGVAIAESVSGKAVSASRFGGATHPVPIDYAGPPGTVLSVSYSQVYAGRFPPGIFAGKTVIVGASDPTLQDLHQTPLGGTPMSGPEIQANIAATVLRGLPLQESAGSVTVLLIVLLALAIAGVGGRLGTLGVALSGAGALAVWALATQLAFDSGTVLDFSDPAASLMLATGGTVLVGLWADSRERLRLRNLFAADSEDVVQEVLSPTGPKPLEPTAIIAGYRIEHAVARGGMGVVYRATQLDLERPVALKLIAAERSQDAVFRSRFKLESRLAASIEHPNVIPIYEAGEDDGLLFIAMRLVEGVDLGQLLDDEGALEPLRAARLVAQLAGALDAAHNHGLVHRDVKPGNTLLTSDQPEHVYLTDFGVAKNIGAEAGVTTSEQWVGTIDYLAPEQIRGEAPRAGADIYALAGLLYSCLTGEVPFPRDSAPARLWAHINAPPPAPSAIRSELPAALDDVIARGMAKDSADRYSTAAELAEACATAVGIVPQVLEAKPVSPSAREASVERHAPTVISEQAPIKRGRAAK
jgi:CHASE2 domain-containing sensor protein